jgi:predicted RNase H-like HicB family nuclease
MPARKPAKATVNVSFEVLTHEEEGGFWAEVPSLSGCFTQGETRDELEEDLREAIALYVEPAPEKEAPGPAVRQPKKGAALIPDRPEDLA